MRPIKFRAWIKTEKRYLTQEEMNEIGGYYYNQGVSDMDGEAVLEQFTGLPDKNGKKIWEGDIISDGYIKREIKFKNARFEPFYEVLDQRDDFTILGALYRFEVIGNIHENPEILK